MGWQGVWNGKRLKQNQNLFSKILFLLFCLVNGLKIGNFVFIIILYFFLSLCQYFILIFILIAPKNNFCTLFNLKLSVNLNQFLALSLFLLVTAPKMEVIIVMR